METYYKMSINTVIFDLDGTLLDTLDDLHASVNHALAQSGFPLRTRDEVRAFVGNGIRKLIERAVPDGTGAEDTERVFELFKAHYSAHCRDSTAPYPGMSELMSALKSAGYKLGVVSNKADAPVKELIAHFFPDTFGAVIGERSGVRRKPAPDSVLSALGELGSSREEAVYVGDSDVDAQTAQNALLPCILVSWGFKSRAFLETLGADAIADSTAELGVFVEKLGKV